MSRLIVSVLFVLGACASQEQFESNLRTWFGAPEQELIQTWGPPTSVYESGGTKFLTFNKTRTVYMPGVAPTYQTNCGPSLANCTTQTVGGVAAMNFNMACSTTFAVVNGKITNARYEGNDCRK